MKDKFIIVTGGAGYIGSHTCKALALAGYTPVTVDNLTRGHRELVKWGPLVEADLHDTGKLVDALRHYKPAAVIHFAALAYVGESVKQPDLYYRNNVGGTLNLLECMKTAGVNRIIFSSSCATYGIPHTVPIPETHTQIPVNPYGVTKLMCERMIQDYVVAFGGSYLVLRYFNASGADSDGDTGEWHEDETHLIPNAILAALGKKPALNIFGTDYDTPDGTCVRDYIHVTDLADAHVRGLSLVLADKSFTGALNLGTGNGCSIHDIVAIVERVTGKNVPLQTAPRRPGDPPMLVAQPGKAAQVLGWNPEHSEIDTIVKTAYQWHRSHETAPTP